MCELYLQGLLSDTPRKNVEAMALGLDGPDSVRNLQRFVTEYKWDEGWMRRRHWELCAERLSDDQGVWSVDASEFAKKGEESVGVAPQYCGALGKTANCQSGVFVCYASPQGHALLDSRLYLPQCWFEKGWTRRREQCRIPEDVTFHLTIVDLLAQALEARGKRHYEDWAGALVGCYTTFFRGTPLLCQLFLVYYGLGQLRPQVAISLGLAAVDVF